MSRNFSQGFDYVYGGRRGTWFSCEFFKTAEEAEEAGINSMVERVMNGYGVGEDYGIFLKSWTCESDIFGILKQTTSTELVSSICKEYVNSVNWEAELHRRISELHNPSTAQVEQIDEWMNNLLKSKKLTDEGFAWLGAFLELKTQVREILSGDFSEGSWVTVNIDGHTVTRKVRWSGQAKDLYVVKDNKKYFFCEFQERNE